MGASAVKTENCSVGFLKGAFVLTLGMIVVKICGLLQKVLLTNLYSTLGGNFAEFGTALFSNAYELYIPLFTLATVGFPVAVSRLVSENYALKRYKDIRQIYKVSLPLFFVMGLVCFLIMSLGSAFYVNKVIRSPYSLPALLMLSPTILFGCLVSVYRGYFEGLRNMTPTAVSEIIEALLKIGIGVVLSYAIVNTGVNQYSSTGKMFGIVFQNTEDAYRTLVAVSVSASVFGITLGSVAAFLYLKIRFSKKKGDIPPEYYSSSLEAISKKDTLRKMWKAAMPVGIGALVMSFSSSLDAIMVQNLIYNMAKNFPEEMMLQFNHILDEEISSSGDVTIHTCVWGYYSASLTLSSLVIAVTQVFGTSALPNVTAAYTKGNKNELAGAINTVLRLTSSVAFPCGIGMCVLAKPILSFVYSGNKNIALFGTDVLQLLGIAALFTGIVTPVCAMLMGLGQMRSTMSLYVFGTAVKLLTSFTFARKIQLNITGAAIASLTSNMFMCAVSLFLLAKKAGVLPDFLVCFLKPMLSATLCGVCAWLCAYVLSLNLMISIVISAIFYIFALVLLHTFTRNEILFLPNGKKIAKVLAKMRLIE